MAASQSQIQSKVQAHGHGRAPGQRRPICADCTKPLRLCLCGRLRSPPLDNAIGVTVLQHAQEAHHPLNSTRLARLGLRNLAVAQVTDVNHRACFLLRILNDATRSDLRGEKRSDLCTTLVGNDGDSNASRKIETESSHDFREKSGDHQGERFYLLTLHGGHCGYLDGKVSARSDSDKMNSWSGSIEKDAHLAGFGQVGGERMDHGAVHDRICCNLDVEFCGMGCTPDSGESFVCETKKMKNSDDFCEINGNRVDFWQDEAARADLGNSRMSVKNFKSDSDAAGELHVEGESCVTGGADAWCLAPTHMTSCSDRDQGISNCWNEAPCGASRVGGLGFASSQIEISGNLGQKLVDCGNELQSSNTCSVILPMNGEKSENSAVNVVNNGEYHNKLEKEVKYMVKDNLVHPLPANSSEFHLMPIHEFNGECKENIEVDAATQQNCTMKSMDKCEIAYTENELKIAIEHAVKPKIRWLSRAPIGQAAVSKGFVIMKIRTKKCNLTGEVWEFEEFSLTIPPGSALLFPCQHSTSIDASDCQVRHLIVLDGTWAKAQRMYHENPWLQLLPHLKLESDRVSLYSEVRHEPRAGCLSTIESIVCAMKKLGEDAEGLDDLLDVFESMIADQRRCKDENWKQKQKSLS